MKCRPIISTWAVLLVVAAVGLAFAAGAAAELTGKFAAFQNCDYTNSDVTRCLYSLTDGGEIVLGKRKVPIVNPVELQAGYNSPTIEKNIEEGYSKLTEPKNGMTLSKAPQPVPGGLAGLVNCDEISNIVLSMICRIAFENSLTGVDAVLELARPASEVRISENHMAEGLGVALKIPVKAHLENLFLGDSCYVGSSDDPIIWSLTSGPTSTLPGTPRMTGTVGQAEYFEKVTIASLPDSELVDNAWAVPKANGCGGPFSFLVNPIVNASVGLPSAVGKNTARIKTTISTTTAAALEKNNAENP